MKRAGENFVVFLSRKTSKIDRGNSEEQGGSTHLSEVSRLFQSPYVEAGNTSRA
jgi:hypothetical protein